MFSSCRIISIGLAITSMTYASETQSEQIAKTWQDSFSAAEALAQKHQLPMVVHFHASWCGPCKSMERTVLSQPGTLELLGSRVIGVKVNSDLQRDLVSRFGVTSLPTDIFLDPQGKEINRTVGSQDLSVYLDRLRSLSSSVAALPGTTPVPQGRVSRGTSVPVSPPASTSPARTQDQLKSPATVQLVLVLRMVPVEQPESVAQNESSIDTGVDAASVTLRSEVDSEGYRHGLGGYSPVSLANEKSWVTGLIEHVAEYKGVRYLFASEAELQQFTDNPQAFVPTLHGFDPVAFRDRQVLSAGKLALSVQHEQRVYFFESTESRATFLRNPSTYSNLNELQLFRRETTIASADPVN